MQRGKSIFSYWWGSFLTCLFIWSVNFYFTFTGISCKNTLPFPPVPQHLCWFDEWLAAIIISWKYAFFFSPFPFLFYFILIFWGEKDPAIATSNRSNGAYESFDRGTQAEAWITEADGKTPLLGEVNNNGYKKKICALKLETVITSVNICSPCSALQSETYLIQYISKNFTPSYFYCNKEDIFYYCTHI